MYKLIATDCDGTILNSEGFLPEEVIDTFKALHKKGIHILPVTGRNDILAKDYLDEMGINCPVSGCNGATLTNFYTNKNYYTKSMSKETLDKIFDICGKENIAVKVFTTDTCYTNDRELYEGGINLIVTKYKKILKNTINYKLIDNIYDASTLSGVVKAVIIQYDIKKLTDIKDKINALVPGVKAVQSNWNCIDINRADVSKGTAVIEYAKAVGVNTDEIIAFGDSENDISMLKAAGLGVAVKNADDSVKSAADKIIDTNDNCGVAKFLKEVFDI